MIVSLIVAAAENNVIGKDNKLLWHLPEDLKFFKNITWGLPVIMGRKTFVELGNKPLPGRQNIIVTRQKDFSPGGTVVVNNTDDAFFVARQADTAEVFVIGGGEIYKQLMPKVQRMYITRVHAMPEGDAFFPAFDESKWNLVWSKKMAADEKHPYDFTFQKWERK